MKLIISVNSLFGGYSSCSRGVTTALNKDFQRKDKYIFSIMIEFYHTKCYHGIVMQHHHSQSCIDHLTLGYWIPYPPIVRGLKSAHYFTILSNLAFQGIIWISWDWCWWCWTIQWCWLIPEYLDGLWHELLDIWFVREVGSTTQYPSDHYRPQNLRSNFETTGVWPQVKPS